MSIKTNLTGIDYLEMIKHHLNIALVVTQNLPPSQLRDDFMLDLISCREVLPQLLNPEDEEQEEEETVIAHVEPEEEVEIMACPPSMQPAELLIEAEGPYVLPCKIDGFLVPKTIPDDKRLGMLGIPVLVAYCKGHDLAFTEAPKEKMILALGRKRDGKMEAPTAGAGEIITSTRKSPPVPKKLKPIDFTGWGKEAVNQYMRRVQESTWSVPLMVEFCRQSGFILPPTLPDFFKQLQEAAYIAGWKPEESRKEVEQIGVRTEPMPKPSAPAPSTPPTPKSSPKPSVVAPSKSSEESLKEQVRELLKKPTLGNLSRACDLVPGLKNVDRSGTGAMKIAINEWLGNSTATSAQSPPTVPTQSKGRGGKVADNPLTPRPTQVRILKALSKHGELTKKQIATLSPCNESDVTYWVGSFDEAVMDKGESYRGMKCLIRLGMVEAEMQQVTQGSELVDVMVHRITDQGTQWLADNPTA